MLNLEEIDESLLLYRGQYSTVRARHEDEMKQLQILCGQLSTSATQILRRVQIDDDSEPVSVQELIAFGRCQLDKIEVSVKEVDSLAAQRSALKPLAWPK